MGTTAHVGYVLHECTAAFLLIALSWRSRVLPTTGESSPGLELRSESPCSPRLMPTSVSSNKALVSVAPESAPAKK